MKTTHDIGNGTRYSNINFTRTDKVVGVLTGISILAAFSQTPSVKSLGNVIGNKIDNAIYDKDVTSDRYALAKYVVQRGDNISRISHGNQMLEDYIILANGIKNVGTLHPGSTLTIPTKSDNGKTLPELIAEYSASH